ncbi:MAG TPA: NAD(P)H-dependent glycerol-3-phosphate dehydrogenase [Phycisphaerae bacterium]|nr:NAD(P)H-dependent glycerol-3-phosphate dehydrogenase [Phycisphaerae bacterium]
MLSKATVMGTGAMGTVMAQVLATNGVRVALLGRRRELVEEIAAARENRLHLPGLKLSRHITPTVDQQFAFSNTELVVSAVPCQYLRAAWEHDGWLLPAGVPVCSATKGIEHDTLYRPSEIIDQCVGDNAVAVLSGPSVAPEIARCLPATVVVASAAPGVAEEMQAALSTSWFRVYTNPDVLGVELAGAIKNVIALAAGILDGLRAGDNAKAALLTRGLAEIARLGVALGAHPQTFMGLAGVGDLVTTCVSPLGRNRSAGQAIGQGVPVEQVVRDSAGVIEGIPTAGAVLKLAARVEVEMPITRAVHEVLFEDKPPLAAITELMRRPLKPEDHG